MKEVKKMSIPVPFQYQGSKRKLAPEIAKYLPQSVNRLVEPFCGTGSLSLYIASTHPNCRFWLNDINEDLIRTMQEIIENPADLADKYKEIWSRQFQISTNPIRYFYDQRDLYNAEHKPEQFLFMMARIVKGSIRYNPTGQLNQSCDNRRYGTRPERMKNNLFRVCTLLKGKSICTCMDYKDVLRMLEPGDVIYLDPPYQGTSTKKDFRYIEQVNFDELIEQLQWLNERYIPFILSYDGENGQKYGKDLPESLHLIKILMSAGRSTQYTLMGMDVVTTEAIYLSPALQIILDNYKIQENNK